MGSFLVQSGGSLNYFSYVWMPPYVLTPPICSDAPSVSDAPHICVPLMLPCTSVCFYGVSVYDIGMGASMYPICLGSEGASSHLSGILVSVSTSIVSVYGLILTGLDISGCLLCFMLLDLSL